MGARQVVRPLEGLKQPCAIWLTQIAGHDQQLKRMICLRDKPKVSFIGRAPYEATKNTLCWPKQTLTPPAQAADITGLPSSICVPLEVFLWNSPIGIFPLDFSHGNSPIGVLPLEVSLWKLEVPLWLCPFGTVSSEFSLGVITLECFHWIFVSSGR